MNETTYFLYKNGVYGHGVFWIGTDVGEGERMADKAANLDRDRYHTWELYKFVTPSDVAYISDANHELVYTGVRRYGADEVPSIY